MSRTYRATGINLKAMPMGEADRLLTILTREYGLMQAIAMGARKHNSSLAGRSGLFVVNNLLIAKGRSLDKITQAETLESYPGLGQDLKKLTASQYLAELCLYQALSEQPQEELFVALNQHLNRIEQATEPLILPHLTQAIVHLLELAGIAPQVYRCCVTGQRLVAETSDPGWRIGFSVAAGGAVTLASLEQLSKGPKSQQKGVAEAGAVYPKPHSSQRFAQLNRQLTATELILLQSLAQTNADVPEILTATAVSPPASDRSQLNLANEIWLAIEQLLRQYAQYHFDRPIRSASLMDTCFLSSSPSPQTPEL